MKRIIKDKSIRFFAIDATETVQESKDSSLKTATAPKFRGCCCLPGVSHLFQENHLSCICV